MLLISWSVAFFCWSTCAFMVAALSCTRGIRGSSAAEGPQSDALPQAGMWRDLVRLLANRISFGQRSRMHAAACRWMGGQHASALTAYAFRRLRASRARSSSPLLSASSARRYHSSCIVQLWVLERPCLTVCASSPDFELSFATSSQTWRPRQTSMRTSMRTERQASQSIVQSVIWI